MTIRAQGLSWNGFPTGIGINVTARRGPFLDRFISEENDIIISEKNLGEVSNALFQAIERFHAASSRNVQE